VAGNRTIFSAHGILAKHRVSNIPTAPDRLRAKRNGRKKYYFGAGVCRADSFGPAIRAGTVLDFILHLQIDRSADTLYRIPHDYEILSKTPVYIVGKAIYSLAQMHRSTAQHKRGPRKAPALSVPRLGKIRKLLQILRRANPLQSTTEYTFHRRRYSRHSAR